MKVKVIKRFSDSHYSMQSKHSYSESRDIKFDLEKWKAYYIESSYWGGDIGNGIPPRSSKNEGEIDLPDVFIYLDTYEDNYRERVSITLVAKREKPVCVELLYYRYESDLVRNCYDEDDCPPEEWNVVPELEELIGDINNVDNIYSFIRMVKESEYIELPDEFVNKVIEKYKDDECYLPLIY